MRLCVLAVLLGSLAAYAGGFDKSFSGTGRGGGSGGAAPVVRPTSFAWYGDSIAAGACSPRPPTLSLQALLNSGSTTGDTEGGWRGSTNAGDGMTPAIGAYTAAQIRARYTATRDTACGGERCGYYLIEGGINSVVNGATPTATLADMEAIVDDLLTLAPSVRIVWSNIMPCRGSAQCETTNPNAWNLALAYNAAWAARCALKPGVYCLDVGAGTEFEDPSNLGRLPPTYTCDGIHLVQLGTNRFATLARGGFP